MADQEQRRGGWGDPVIPADEEQRIREDERQRLLAGSDRATDPPAATAEEPVAATTYAAHQQAGEPYVVNEDTVTERGFSPGQVLIFLAGAALLALGIAAVIATGLDGSLSEPVEEVLGWNHTALLGLIEIGAGALLVLSALRAGARWLGGLVGVALVVGGALILGELGWTVNELGAEQSFGWVPIVIGAIAVVGAAIPRIRRTRRVTTTRSGLA